MNAGDGVKAARNNNMQEDSIHFPPSAGVIADRASLCSSGAGGPRPTRDRGSFP